MSYYDNVYLRRVNRFGNDYQSRLQGQREKVFEDLLLKSIYRVDFEYHHKMEPGLLERYNQNDTQILQYLLTRISLELNGGDVLEITDQDGRTNLWMVYWLEYIEASGYNRYIVIRMSHQVSWTHELGKENPKYFTSPAYFFGKQRLALREKEKSSSGSIYLENSKEFTLIMPQNDELKVGDYFEIKTGQTTQGYRVTGFDIVSTQGVEFVTVDPVYLYDKSTTPIAPIGTQTTDYDWFTGDFKEA